MAKPTIYRSDDPNAPVLQKTSSSDASNIINLFKKCLVEGYNLDDVDVTKRRAGLGWTVVGEDPNNMGITLRNNTSQGSGRVVQITSTDGQNMTMYAAHDASGYGVENMVSRFSDTSLNTLPYFAGSSSSFPWVLIASGKSFIFMSHHTSSVSDMNNETVMKPLNGHQASVALFGDFKPFDTNDGNTTLVSAGGYGASGGFTVPTKTAIDSSQVGLENIQIAGGVSGALNKNEANILGMTPYGYCFGEGGSSSNLSNFGDINPLDYIHRPIIGGGAENRGVPRGYLFNIYASLIFPKNLYVPYKIYENDGRQYYCFVGWFGNTGCPCFFVRVDDWEE